MQALFRNRGMAADEAVANIRKVLGSVVRVSVCDGRVLIGTLICIDGEGNTVLQDCEEWIEPSTASGENRVEASRRWLGLLNIKRDLLISLEADASRLR